MYFCLSINCFYKEALANLISMAAGNFSFQFSLLLLLLLYLCPSFERSAISSKINGKPFLLV